VIDEALSLHRGPDEQPDPRDFFDGAPGAAR
jgi:hypothetical protein